MAFHTLFTCDEGGIGALNKIATRQIAFFQIGFILSTVPPHPPADFPALTHVDAVFCALSLTVERDRFRGNEVHFIIR